MSLLDDVSIVITPNAYKAGELYAVIPVPTEGAELLTNGDFANGDTGWSNGGTTSFSNSQVTITGVSYIVQSNLLTIGKNYKLTINVDSINTNSGTVIAALGSGSDPAKQSLDQAGNLTFYFYDITFGSNWIQIFTTSDATVTVNSISVKEYTSADMDVTRATAATRVDEDGLVNYAEVIGSEEVTCGDFSCAVPLDSWTVGSKWSIGVSGARLVSSTSAASSLVQSNVFEIGKIYKVTLDAVVISGKAKLEGSGGSAQFLIEETKTYTEYFVASKEDFYLNRVTSVSDIYIDNISVKEVTRDNVPRIDYTGGGCPHILAEPMRTNNLTASQDLTNLFWNSISTETIVASTVLSPDGTTFGFKAIPSASSGNTTHYVDYDYGFLSMPIGEVTYSIFVKPFGYTNFQLATSSGMNSRYQNFELTGDGVLGAGDVNGAKIEKIGDWYRCSITETSVSASPRVLNIGLPSSGLGRNPSFTGSGTDGVLLWGGQIEEGTYATSYIPNLSTTSGSTVTRNQDIFTRDGIGSLINSTEGVLFVEMAALANDGSYRVITISDGTSSNYIALYYTRTSNSISWELKVGNAVQFSRSVSLPLGSTSFNKFAFKYKENDCKLFLNGVESDIYTSNVTFTSNTLNSLFLTNGDGILLLFGKVKQLQVYDTALTDEQLLQLTGESGTDFYESYAEMAAALTYTLQ